MTRNRFKLSLQARFMVALALPATLILLVAVVGYWALDQNSRAAHLMLRVSKAQTQYQRLLTAVLDAETGTRGYVITGDIAFLAPYRQAPVAFADAIEEIQSLEAEQHANGLSMGVEQVREVQALFERWREQVAVPVIEARRQHPVALESLANEALGQFDRLRNPQEGVAQPEVIVEMADLLFRGRALAEAGPTHQQWQAAQVALEYSREILLGGTNGAATEEVLSLQRRLLALIAATQFAEQAVMSPIQQGLGKNITDRVRELLAESIAQEGRHLDAQVTRTDRTSLIAKLVVGVGIIGAPVVGLTLSMVLLGAVGQRLRQVSVAADAVSAGDFKQRVPIEGNDGLARLSKTFNRMAADLQRRQQDAELLDQLGQTLQACRDLDEAHCAVARFGPCLFPDRSGALYSISASRNLAEMTASWGDPPDAERKELISPADCWALREARVHHWSRGGASMPCAHLREPEPGASLCLPLTSADESMGVLTLATRNGDSAFSDYERLLASSVAVQIKLALGNLMLRETLRAQSIRDPLTGLFNRRYLEETLERELHRATRGETPLALVMLDLDHFKQLNDHFGHDAGDMVLKHIGTLLANSVRGSDMACRYGGEEFMLVLAGADADRARQCAEEIGAAIAAQEFTYREVAIDYVTASFGVGAFPENAEKGDDLIRVVDEAMYRAKNAGRNRVEQADPIGEA